MPTFSTPSGLSQPDGSQPRACQIHQPISTTASSGTTTPMTTSHQRPTRMSESAWLSCSSRNFRTPTVMTAMAKNRPDNMSATPQTQSWLWSTWSEMADGRPSRNPARPTIRTARVRSTPASRSTRLPSSIIESRLVKAAKASATKNSTMNIRPSGRRAKSCGIQMKVSPSLPAPKMVRWIRSGVSASPARTAVSSAGYPRRASGVVARLATSCGTTEKTVHMTMMPASREMVLFAAGRITALRAVSSCCRM